MKYFAAMAAVCLSVSCVTSHASPSDYVSEPAADKGEFEIDVQTGANSRRPMGSDVQAAIGIGFGYGIAEHWFTEIVPKWERTQPGGTHPDAIEWENKFIFTEPGEYPFDLGVLTEIERPKNHANGWEVRTGPILRTNFDKWDLTTNALFTRHYRAAEAQQTEFGYQLQAKYRWKREAEFGIQGFGELGPWNHLSPASEQSQRFGPAFFGKVTVGEHQVLRYNTAWLIGTTSGSPKRSFRLQIELEM